MMVWQCDDICVTEDNSLNSPEWLGQSDMIAVHSH